MAFGTQALYRNTTGAYHTAFGSLALYGNTTGINNVAIGYFAGVNQNTGSDNIYLANPGMAGESGVIKVGNAALTATYIEGIDGVTLPGAGSAVYVDASNQLGTAVSSSLRTKTDVVDMGDASDVLEALRPVRFRYRGDRVGEEQARVVHYGLVAEEVAAVAPHLVNYETKGRPDSVQYRLLTPLRLNEVQQQQQVIERQAKLLAAHEERLARDRYELDALRQWVCTGDPATEPCL